MTIEIDHTSLSVSDYEKAKAFYTAALSALRGGALMEFPMDDGSKVVGLGVDGKPFLWIAGGGKTTPHIHLALRAENRDQVDAFYAAALAAGGTDNGPPGLRPHYHEHYYAAFVLDPDGHNVEAVSHADPNAAPAKPARTRRTAKVAAKAPRGGKKPARRAAAKKVAAKPARKAAKPTGKAAKKPAARTAARRKPAGRKRAR